MLRTLGIIALLSIAISSARAADAQLAERIGIIFSSAAYITNPGRKVGNGNQFIAQPRKIGDVIAMHLPGLTFVTWEGGAV